MSEPVTQRQFYDEMQHLRTDFQTMHTRLRDSMTEGFQDLGLKVDTHKLEDASVERRVSKIEIERDGEKAQALKHGAWAGILGAALVQALIPIWKALWK